MDRTRKLFRQRLWRGLHLTSSIGLWRWRTSFLLECCLAVWSTGKIDATMVSSEPGLRGELPASGAEEKWR
jgi:hypothetical protein